MTNFEYDSLLNICQNNKQIIDYIKDQYITLLSFLTNTPNISTELFLSKINDISKIGEIIVCYHKNVDNKHITIIGSGTIIYEPKIIHECRNVGHIEDIVVHSNYRSHGIAKNILNRLIHSAKVNNCYKVILDCKKDLEFLYERIGFKYNGSQMSIYF